MILNPKLFKETVLFEDVNGKIGDIDFLKNSLSYKKIKIEYTDGNAHSEKEFEIENNKQIPLNFHLVDSDGNAYFYVTIYKIITNGLKLYRSGSVTISIANEMYVNKTNVIKITKVKGYHY